MLKHPHGGFFWIISCIILLAAAALSSAETLNSVAGVIGTNKKGDPSFVIPDGRHKGNYHIVHDIKGIIFYPGAHVLAYNAKLTDSTIQFEKFDWLTVRDFMLASHDLIAGWELSKNASEREIPVTMKLPSLYQPAPVPVKGYAQRLIAHTNNDWRAVQIRYYEFTSPSDAAQFAERWSPIKSVKRDTSEHFRRSFDRYGVWVINADDERKPPDYWTARFVLESLSRKLLISKDTSIIFNTESNDPVLFNAERDTYAPGDTVVLIGQGYSPILSQNTLIFTRDTVKEIVPPISATSREITTQIPFSYLDSGETSHPLTIEVQIQRYYRSNALKLTVHRKE